MATQKIKILLAFLLLSLSHYGFSEDIQFTVLLNEKPIGEHLFSITNNTIKSQAKFDVKLWIIPAYKYRHEAEETYKENCLIYLKSDTQDGADTYSIKTVNTNDDLNLVINGQNRPLPTCVQSFRYWDQNFINQKNAINPQDGEIYELTFSQGESDQVRVNDQKILCTKYTLKAYKENDEKFHIEVWYEKNSQRWVKLRSFVENDNVLDYTLNE